MKRTKTWLRQTADKSRRPFFDKQSGEEKSKFFTSDQAVQRKSNIGQVNDPFEKEADMAARQVVTEGVQKAENKEEEKPLQKAEKKEEEPLQKAEKKEEEKPLQAKLAIQRQKKEEEPVQAKEQNNTQPMVQKAAKEPESAHEPTFETLLKQRKGRGFQLPRDIRIEMEKKFETDFSQVRIHTDTEAAAMCEQIHALAFTKGYDIYFNEGRYNPNATSGKELLAHELTHVVQQKGC